MAPFAASGQFETFGVSHLVMLALFVIGIGPVVWVGRRVRGTTYEVPVSRAYALAIPAFTVPLQVIDFLPGNYDLATTLPLQLCDLAWVAAVIALWTRHRTAVALTYYWGLALTSQALLTPWLVRDFPDPKFIAFWGMHLLIVWSAIYLTWGVGARPSWRGYRATVAITFVWLVFVYVFNELAGTNYGFVNEKPSTASILDYFGPWPVYVAVEMLVVAVLWALMTWPWVRRSRAS